MSTTTLEAPSRAPAGCEGLPDPLLRVMGSPWAVQNKRHHPHAKPYGVEVRALAAITLAAAEVMGVEPADLVGSGPGGRYHRRGIVARWLATQTVARHLATFSPTKVQQIVFAAGHPSISNPPQTVQDALARKEVDATQTVGRVAERAAQIMRERFEIGNAEDQPRR